MRARTGFLLIALLASATSVGAVVWRCAVYALDPPGRLEPETPSAPFSHPSAQSESAPLPRAVNHIKQSDSHSPKAGPRVVLIGAPSTASSVFARLPRLNDVLVDETHVQSSTVELTNTLPRVAPVRKLGVSCEETVVNGRAVIRGLPYSAANFSFGYRVGQADSVVLVPTSDIAVLGAEEGIGISPDGMACAELAVLVPRHQTPEPVAVANVQVFEKGALREVVVLLLAAERKEELRIEKIDAPSDWPKGGSVPIRIRIRNAGNTPDTVEFHSSSRDVTVSSSRPIILDPDVVATVDATLRIAGHLPAGSSQLVRITPAEVARGAVIRGTIRPSVLGSSSPALTIDVAPWYVSGPRGGRGMDGGAMIGVGGKRSLTLRLSGGEDTFMPNVRHVFSDQPWDVLYKGPVARIHAGHVSTGSSQLIERLYRGTGVEGALDFGGLSIKGHAIRVTQRGDSGAVYGVGLGRAFQRFLLEASAQVVSDSSTRLSGAKLKASYSGSDRGFIAEVGASEPNRFGVLKPTVMPVAYLEGHHRVLGGSARVAALARAGSFDDLEPVHRSVDARISVPVARSLALSAQGAHSSSDSSYLQSAVDYTRASIGADARIAGVGLSVHANHSRNSTGGFFGGSYATRRNTIDARIARSTSSLGLMGSVEIGEEEAYRGDERDSRHSGTLYRAMANASYRMGSSLVHAGLFASQIAEEPWRVSAHAGGDLRLAGQRLRMRVTADPSDFDRWSGYVTTDLYLGEGRSVVLGVERSSLGDTRFGVQVRQTLGIGLPTRLRDRGRGRVVADLNRNGMADDGDEPVAGVMLRFGDEYVYSDAEGEYTPPPASLSSVERPEVVFAPSGRAAAQYVRRGDLWDILLTDGGSLRIEGVQDIDMNGCAGDGEPRALVAPVRIVGPDGTIVHGTLRNGMLLVPNLRPGTHHVSSMMGMPGQDYSHVTVEVEIGAGETTQIRLPIPTANRPIDFDGTTSGKSCSLSR